jgi:hypothetical protein
MHEELIYVLIASGFLVMLLVIFSFFTVGSRATRLATRRDSY